MKKGLLITAIVLVCAVIITAFGCGYAYIKTSNNLIEMRNLAEAYESDIQAELQARYDKVGNLVKTVTAASKHEQEVIDSIAEARAKYNSAFSSEDTALMIEADAAIKTVITNLQEKYPEITAMEMYTRFFDEYSGIEATVTLARKNYNQVVMMYNNAIEKFPGSIIAEKKGYERIEGFKATEEANQSVVVDFNY